jgi:hypothetical protein
VQTAQRAIPLDRKSLRRAQPVRFGSHSKIPAACPAACRLEFNRRPPVSAIEHMVYRSRYVYASNSLHVPFPACLVTRPSHIHILRRNRQCFAIHSHSLKNRPSNYSLATSRLFAARSSRARRFSLLDVAHGHRWIDLARVLSALAAHKYDCSHYRHQFTIGDHYQRDHRSSSCFELVPVIDSIPLDP